MKYISWITFTITMVFFGIGKTETIFDNKENLIIIKKTRFLIYEYEIESYLLMLLKGI